IANYVSYEATGRIQLIPVGGTTEDMDLRTIEVCDDRTGNVGINLDINTVGRVNTTRSIACP
ncbi:MAG: hypothetical protein Q7U30_11190, partial [Methylicorpusculum sp.]|nr:hypothetical protein [Methylicorpusculum sp.]